jgi:hypothetical protein
MQALWAFFCLRKSPILLQVGFAARQPKNFRPAMLNPQDHSRSTIAAIATAAVIVDGLLTVFPAPRCARKFPVCSRMSTPF